MSLPVTFGSRSGASRARPEAEYIPGVIAFCAVLAVQNLKGLNMFNASSDNAIEYSALEGSLQMMSQVLNDVLDFSRMERGGFSSVSRPFSLHNLMRSIFVPLRLDAASRGLELETSLDTRVDELARFAAFPDETIGIVREGDGMVMGDEMRLRQIIGNLISNACSTLSLSPSLPSRTVEKLTDASFSLANFERVHAGRWKAHDQH